VIFGQVKIYSGKLLSPRNVFVSYGHISVIVEDILPKQND